jgi:hypothetical protein
VGGALGTVAVAAAAQRYGMSACLSATSLMYLSLGALLCLGVWTMKSANHESHELHEKEESIKQT